MWWSLYREAVKQWLAMLAVERQRMYQIGHYTYDPVGNYQEFTDLLDRIPRGSGLSAPWAQDSDAPSVWTVWGSRILTWRRTRPLLPEQFGVHLSRQRSPLRPTHSIPVASPSQSLLQDRFRMPVAVAKVREVVAAVLRPSGRPASPPPTFQCVRLAERSTA